MKNKELYKISLIRKMTQTGIQVNLEISKLEYSHLTKIRNLSPTKVNENDLDKIYFCKNPSSNRINDFTDCELIGYTINNLQELKERILKEFHNIELKHGLIPCKINEYEIIENRFYKFVTFGNEKRLGIELIDLN